MKRSLGIEDVKFGKVSVGRTEQRIPCLVVDLPEDISMNIVHSLESTKLPQGLSIQRCEVLPHIAVEYGSTNKLTRRFEGSDSRYGGRSGGDSAVGNSRSYSPQSRGGGGYEHYNDKFRKNSDYSSQSSITVPTQRKSYTPSGRSYSP